MKTLSILLFLNSDYRSRVGFLCNSIERNSLKVMQESFKKTLDPTLNPYSRFHPVGQWRKLTKFSTFNWILSQITNVGTFLLPMSDSGARLAHCDYRI